MTVAVEIALPDDRPHAGRGSNPGPLRDLRAFHLPHRHIAAGVTPENVAAVIVVEVVGVDVCFVAMKQSKAKLGGKCGD